MNIRKQHGFTIIEVVLVLAIAGLIFLMVFIALPALQKGQRDTQRRNDVSRFRAQVNQYQANNKGAVPSALNIGTFKAGYLDGSGGWKDPLTGSDYALKAWNTASTDAVNMSALTNAGDWTYKDAAVCNGEAISTAGSPGSRQYAVVMKLEGAGMSCQDNQ